MTRKTRTPKNAIVLLALLSLLMPGLIFAQQTEEKEGVNQGNYNVKQSFEFGGRITDFTGNKAVYRTYDNLTSGPRLLEHSLQMRSLNHQGWLFDDFFLNSFGYGGDPNAVTRLRAYKNKWYNFSGTFRMARNQWDYNLLANPLNPVNPAPPSALFNPAFPLDTSTPFSLHKFETVRRLSDYNLTIAPQSRLRFRLGYSRNIMEGPSFTTFHEGTDILVFQNWKTTLNSVTFGFDFRGLPKTNISYDQFLHYYKGDTTWLDIPGAQPLQIPRVIAQLTGGRQVDLGIIFNQAITAVNSRQPCGTPISDNTTTPVTANPTCNGYLYYDRAGNVRTNYPTEQISLQTHAIPNFDVSARFAYSSSDADVVDYQENANGRVSRTNQRVFGFSGPSEVKRVSATADAGLTWHVLDRLRLVDSFHFTHFRLPGQFNLTECSLFGTTLATNPTQWTGQTTLHPVCARALAAGSAAVTAGTPTHSTSSPADVINETISWFLGQSMKQNQLEGLFDVTSKINARLGYRYTKREIREFRGSSEDLLYFPGTVNRGSCALVAGVLPAGCVQNADGSIRFTDPFAFGSPEDTEINEHVFLLGVSVRPSSAFRASFDLEIGSSDETFTRISPRNFQLYRLRGTYKPHIGGNQPLTLGFTFNILERQNDVTEIFHKQHNRTFGFTAIYEPNEKWAFDLGYDFNDVFSRTNICFTLTATPLPPGSSPCPPAAASVTQAISLYDQDTQYGYFNVLWNPVRRVRTRLGYTVVSTTGDTLIFTIVTPPGTLRYNYHKPYAGVDLDLTRGFTFRTNWGYYGYNEKSPPDPTTAPRDFRGNVVTLSVRYDF